MPAVRTARASTTRAPGLRRPSRQLNTQEGDFSDLTSSSDGFLADHSTRRLDATGTRTQSERGAGGSATRIYAANKCTAGPITVKGHVFHPTIVFDTFWKWATERKAIDDRRRLGIPQPWSDDPIFQNYAFCNTFRVLDKLSQYIIREVIEKGPQDPDEVLFRVVLFNIFTKIETWELLADKLGPLTWARYNRKDYERVLTKAKKKGTTLYTGAFQKPAPKLGFKEAHVNHLCLLEIFMENDLPGRFRSAKYLAEIYEFLLSFHSMGEFSTYQLILNLSYTNLFNFSEEDFVVPGPGASSGLGKMFGLSKVAAAKAQSPDIEEDIIRWMVDNQAAQFERLGLEFTGLGPDRLPMELVDVEHALCEVDKYSRKAHPGIRGKSTEIRNSFKPSAAIYPSTIVLPKAWQHPDRKVTRIWPGLRPTKEPRYVVSRIKADRIGSNGKEYLVSWFGYTDNDDTWEPEATLLQDARSAVEEYLASSGSEPRRPTT
ncbi:hypothetical protein DXG03_005606 [Asterophora parasitica]|uniref:Chromo domain-containing protein n=1 Tax=Asterophora parasitica TaxID=117018 RepID=A0A9P7KE78_9AGAR|nr:hypothetical protein DXG03_005606 [Asterophora parasitica]